MLHFKASELKIRKTALMLKIKQNISFKTNRKRRSTFFYLKKCERKSTLIKSKKKYLEKDKEMLS